MNGPTPLVDELLDLASASGLTASSEIAVPGCGYGHDAAHLAARGFAVSGIDFAPRALVGARARYGVAVTWLESDWLTATLGPFDAVLDHTCFVSFEPGRRASVVAAHAARLGVGGLWLGAFFSAVPNADGPPYPIAPGEVRALAGDRFDVLHLGPATRSHRARAGREFLLVARRRATVSDDDPAGAP